MAAAAGGWHSAAVGEDGSLFVWGSGARGQLGTGDTAVRLAPTRIAGLPAPVRQVDAGDRPRIDQQMSDLGHPRQEGVRIDGTRLGNRYHPPHPPSPTGLSCRRSPRETRRAIDTRTPR